MTKPLTPNYNPGVGQLVTYRGDFEKHITGVAFRHQASQIDLNPLITIDGYTSHTVQDVINDLASIINNEHVPLASATVPGLIQLTGDISTSSGGTATLPVVTGIQGKPISTAAPSNGQALVWNSGSWAPTNVSVFMAGGDLTGTSTSQLVVSLTGSSGNVVMLADTLLWGNSVPAAITQAPLSHGAGSDFNISAQSSSFSGGGRGGNLILSGGSPGLFNNAGGVSLNVGPSNPLVQTLALSPTQNIVGLATSSTVTSTNMPTNTGNYVMYVGDATTAPTVAPTGGSILYSISGQICIVQESADFLTLGNPGINTTLITPDNITSGSISKTISNHNTMTYEYTAKLLTISSPTGLNFFLPSGVTGLVKATVVGQELNNYLNYYHTVMYCSFIINNLGTVTLGTTTYAYTSSQGSWGGAGIQSGSGGLVSVATGFMSVGHAVWTVHAELTLSYAIQ